ncbi:uncharacterized protein VTP21DRAFT_477 [Calcarisporiella thermophila]|uniref:uncharacterized protein n=1 Tax=Calcarisporiella thermophila TaxID=911321 RepID=UPI0037420909
MEHWFFEKSIMKVEGNTFAVTGAASGLGEATARLLVANGANVLLIDVNESWGERLAEELGSRALWPGKVDITSEQEVDAAIDQAVSRFGSIRGVVHCGGIIGLGKIVERDGTPCNLDTFREVIEVNLVGTFNVWRLVASRLVRLEPDEDGERGVLISVSSVAYQDGQKGQASYAASKGGVSSLTLPVARDLAKAGVRAMTIAPGMFETSMMSRDHPVYHKIAHTLEFPERPGRPEEFAQLAMHIIQNRYLNGGVIRLDGALRLSKI